MPRYFLELSYDGTVYGGWQVQRNAPSVQETINQALARICRQEIRSMGCGRTDAGVHAKQFFMHFDLEKEVADAEDLLYRMNGLLPESIALKRLILMNEKAHSRFDATERAYEYFIHFHKSPFLPRYSFYQGFYKIELEAMVRASRILTEIKDFSSLCLPSDDFKTNICDLRRAEWGLLPAGYGVNGPYVPEAKFPEPVDGRVPAYGEFLRFQVHSNRFLRGMVRRMVGTLLMVGKGKISVQEFEDTVRSCGSFRVHHLAPPNGLFLSRVVYSRLHL